MLDVTTVSHTYVHSTHSPDCPIGTCDNSLPRSSASSRRDHLRNTIAAVADDIHAAEELLQRNETQSSFVVSQTFLPIMLIYPLRVRMEFLCRMMNSTLGGGGTETTSAYGVAGKLPSP